jgi:hypothetical protein
MAAILLDIERRKVQYICNKRRLDSKDLTIYNICVSFKDYYGIFGIAYYT